MFRMVLLGGFLGAGKTTTALTAARLLRSDGHRVAIITNDQGTDLVDTELAAWALPSAVREVTGGCFCCRFEDLADAVREVVAETAADTVIAEAVGSCADLQATVVRPLRRHHPRMELAPLTTVVEPSRLAALTAPDADAELAYLFDRQLEEADIIALNKIDAQRPAVAARLAAMLRERYPYALVVAYSGARDASALVTAWQAPSPAAREVAVDYDRYAAAEARLAWLNAEARIEGPFEPGAWAMAALESLSEASARAGHLVGHAKLTIRARPTDAAHPGLTKASLVEAGARPAIDLVTSGRATLGAATLNVRMACHPVELDALVRTAARRADEETGAASVLGGVSAFTPAYPRPIHRLTAAFEEAPR